MSIICSFCGKEITKDRYNIMLEIERQDFVPSGHWQKSGDLAKENVCSKCFDTIIIYFKHILSNLRQNKGIYQTEKLTERGRTCVKCKQHKPVNDFESLYVICKDCYKKR